MGFLWETAVQTSGSITINNHYLYVIDVNISGGGSATFDNVPDESAFPEPRPDYVVASGDNVNEWQRVAFFASGTGTYESINVQAPFTGGSTGRVDNMLVAINSCPALSGRDDLDFVMPNNPYDAGLWCAVKGAATVPTGFTENNVIGWGQGQRKPFTNGITLNLREILTATEAHLINGYVIAAVGGLGLTIKDITDDTGGYLMNPTSTQRRIRQSPIYTSISSGGTYTAVVSVGVDAGEDPPNGVDYRWGGAGSPIVDFSPMSQIATMPNASDGRDHFVYSISIPSPFAIGTDLTTIANLSQFNTDVDIDHNNFFSRGVAPFADPWVSNQMPPPYTVTSTNNKCVMGGYVTVP